MTGAASTRTRAVILIIDDTPANLGLMVECLETHGYRLLVAQDGTEGLKRAASEQPDLILLDVMMPGIDGFETCRQLKARADTGQIPVIFMTALAEVQDKLTGFAAGGVDYVTKPVEVEEVLRRVQTHLELNAMRRRLASQAEELRRAQDALEKKEMELALEAIGEPRVNLAPGLFGRALDRRRDTSSSAIESLTDRQREVLRLIGQGKCTKEIAQLLGLSQKTVETHRARMMKSLGLYNITALMHYAIRTGLNAADPALQPH